MYDRVTLHDAKFLVRKNVYVGTLYHHPFENKTSLGLFAYN